MSERKFPFEAFGVECKDGWKGLYQPLLELCKLYNIPVLQVKEKFGGLRFYTGRVDARVDDLIRAAEQESYHVCERCGEHGIAGHSDTGPIYKATCGPVEEGGHWVNTLCNPCRTKLREQREAERAVWREALAKKESK